MKDISVKILRDTYDRVVVKHYREGDQGTRAAIVSGKDIFIGVSRCVKNDQSNKRIGRTIALGRALREQDIMCGHAQRRNQQRETPLSYTITTKTEAEVNDILKKEIFKGQDKPKEKIPVELL